MKIKDIPFSRLTRGEASILIEAAIFEKQAEILKKKGNQQLAAQKMEQAQIIQDVCKIGLHIPNDYPLQNIIYPQGKHSELRAKTQLIINEARQQTAPALNQDTSLLSPSTPSGLNVQFNPTNPSIFDVTQEQVDQCVNHYNEVFGPGSSRAKSVAIRECISRLPFENIIKFHVAESGGVMLYNTIKTQQTQYNNDIAEKDRGQEAWIRGAALTTGLPQIQVQRVLYNSVMEQWGEMPEDIEVAFRPYMAPQFSPNATNIVPQTKTPPLTIPRTGGGTQLKTGDPLIDTIIVIAQVVLAIFNAFRDRQSELERINKAIESTQPIDDRIIWKCWDFNGVEIDCNLTDEVAFTRCFDPDTGEEVPCPEEESGSNFLLIGGIGVAAIGLLFLLGGNRSNNRQEQQQIIPIDRKKLKTRKAKRA